MNLLPLLISAGGVGLAGGAGLIRSRNLDRWLPSYLGQCLRRRPSLGGRMDLILCIADHYEPRWGNASDHTALERVGQWAREYPRLFREFRDADGRPPRHTFFYPLEEYVPEHLEPIAGLCRAGYGEVEVQLHHDGDSDVELRERLAVYKEMLNRRHGLLARRKATGEIVYGFVHGNWALDNSRPDGRWCGVNNEIDVLRETGCYADFTFPSAPSPTQPRKINSIYYAVDDPARPRSHDRGLDVGRKPAPPNSLMLIQGPLVLDWGRRKWGILPRIENGCIQDGQEASIERLASWRRAGVGVSTRPDWYFVKLHAHGAHEASQRVLLGDPMVRFHAGLARKAAEDSRFSFHYVTAREMYNLVRAAEAGWDGSVDSARDLELAWDGAGQAGL